MSYLAGIEYNDTANAPGICVSVYLSGCDFHCKGCHNPETWDFEYGKPLTDDIIVNIVDGIAQNGIKRSLCILGGEPLHPKNLEATKKIIASAKARYSWVKIYVWSGYTLQQLIERATEEQEIAWILDNIYCLIDGPFIQEERDITLQMRGSKNQNINYFEASNISTPLGGII